MIDAEFKKLMDELATCTAESRKVLRELMPTLKLRKLNLETFIDDLEKHPSMLFGYAPPLPSGGHASLLRKEEVECAQAVIRVLKKRLALVNRAMGADRNE